MRLSTKSTYGLRAMVQIARNASASATSIAEIARREGISVAYLEQLLHRLKRHGLVESVRGPNGGYRLSRNAQAITVRDIIMTLEGDTAPVYCVTTAPARRERCARSHQCATKIVWEKLARSIDECLTSITLSDLCGPAGRRSVS